MHELTGNQDAVLEVLRQTIFHLGHDGTRSKQAGIEKLGISRAAEWPSQRDDVIDRLQRAYEREQDKAMLAAQAVMIPAAQQQQPGSANARRSVIAPPAMPSESTAKAWYMPRDRTIAVFQAAMDEYLDERTRQAAPRSSTTGKKKSPATSKSRAVAAAVAADSPLIAADISLFFKASGNGHPNQAQQEEARDSTLVSPQARASLDQYDTLDPGWITVVWEKAKSLLKGKAKFITHTSKSDFRFPLADQAKVALVADWGGGNDAARQVAAQIKARQPDHVIHLGDVYYAGTEREIKNRFLALWDFWSTPATPGRSFALNSNHEMYGGGHAYFKQTLKALKQPASYFALGNQHWRLIGLDTGYVDHDLNREQLDWLGGQLSGSAKNVLLSHHQPFSGFSSEDSGEKLRARVRPFLDAKKIYGWIWGHEHLCIKYGIHEGIKGRCIGHGCFPYDLPGEPSGLVPVEWINRREQSTSDNRGMHGFALLTLDGAQMQIDYIDQDGVVSHTEDYSATASASASGSQAR